MELKRCKRCGSLAQIHIWPTDSREVRIEYVVDCINPDCPRLHSTEPKYRTREEAIEGWNKQQET
jgi:hypothetical protein